MLEAVSEDESHLESPPTSPDQSYSPSLCFSGNKGAPVRETQRKRSFPVGQENNAISHFRVEDRRNTVN